MTRRCDLPEPAELQARYERAARRFRAFRGRDPRKGEIIWFADSGSMMLEIGELDGLIYRVDGRQRGRIHRFAESSRPLLLVSSDGRLATIVNGNWSFTPRGFIG